MTATLTPARRAPTPRELSPFTHAIDDFIADMRAESRIASEHTETAYRTVLEIHSADVDHRHPAEVTKADVKRTLARWANPRTRAQRHTVLKSFFDWCVYEDVRPDNPARGVRPARYREKPMTRLTDAEVGALLTTADRNRRDRWAVRLMLYTGARNAEVRGLTGASFARVGYVCLHGKGDKTRWVPVVPELQGVVDEIRATIELSHYVLPSTAMAGKSERGQSRSRRELPTEMLAGSSLQRQVARVGRQAGLAIEVHPHLLRHAFGEAVARHTDARIAQALLGHASIETTIGTYTNGVRLDDLTRAFGDFDYDGRHPGANASAEVMT